MTRDPSQLAAEAQTPDDSSTVPLGDVKVGNNNGTHTVSIPKETAEGVGIEVDDYMAVGYDPTENVWKFKPVEDFDGW